MKIPEYSMCLIGLRLYYVCLRLWLGSHIIIFLCDIKSINFVLILLKKVNYISALQPF